MAAEYYTTELCMTSDPIWLQEDYVYRVSRIGSTPLCIIVQTKLEIVHIIYPAISIRRRGFYFFFLKTETNAHLLLGDI